MFSPADMMELKYLKFFVALKKKQCKNYSVSHVVFQNLDAKTFAFLS
jgi:hypothetical protein